MFQIIKKYPLVVSALLTLISYSVWRGFISCIIFENWGQFIAKNWNFLIIGEILSVLCVIELYLRKKQDGIFFATLIFGALILFALLACGDWDGWQKIMAAMAYFYAMLLLLRIPNNISAKETKDEGENLNRSKLYRGVCTWIRRMSITGTSGKAIAITGEWGSGKSHLSRYVKRNLTKKWDFDNNLYGYIGEYAICEIDLWGVRNIEDVWSMVEQQLMDVVGEPVISRVEIGNNIFYYLLNFVLGGNSAIYNAVRNLVQNDVTGKVKESANIIAEKLIKSKDKKFAIIFFDDLERANTKVIQNLLPLFERLKSIKNLFVVCNYSPAEINNKLRGRGIGCIDAEAYLSKIFDVKFDIPKIHDLACSEYIKMVFEEKAFNSPLARRFMLREKIHFETPRQIQRIADRLASVEHLYIYDYSDTAWKKLFSVKAIFLAVCAETIKPGISKEMLAYGVAEYLADVHGGTSTTSTTRQIAWDNICQETNRFISHHAVLHEIIKKMQDYIAHEHVSRLINALNNSYMYKAALTLSDVEEMISSLNISSKSRVKRLILNGDSSVIPLQMMLSIELFYKVCMEKIDNDKKYSYAIFSTLRAEHNNSTWIVADDKLPYQHRSQYFIDLINSLTRTCDSSITNYIIKSCIQLMRCTGIESLTKILDYFCNNSITHERSSNKYTIQSSNLNRPLEASRKSGRYLFKYASNQLGVKFCIFLLRYFKKPSESFLVDIRLFLFHDSGQNIYDVYSSITNGVCYFLSKRPRLIPVMQIAAMNFIIWPRSIQPNVRIQGLTTLELMMIKAILDFRPQSKLESYVRVDVPYLQKVLSSAINALNERTYHMDPFGRDLEHLLPHQDKVELLDSLQSLYAFYAGIYPDFH